MHATKLRRTADLVLSHLVADDFEALLSFAPQSRVSAAELRKALAVYGRRPIMPPAPIEGLLDTVEVRGSNPKRWSVNLQFWTKEEGRSDLTLEMHFIDSDAEIYAVEIDDLHML